MASTRRLNSLERGLPLQAQDWSAHKGSMSTEAYYLNATKYTTSEKHRHQFLTNSNITARRSRRLTQLAESLQCLRQSLKLQLLLVIGCATALVLCVQTFLIGDLPDEAALGLLSYHGNDVQAAVATPTPTLTSSVRLSSAGVLEVFQVYQPVLTPDGPTDQTISSDGSSNTTAMESNGDIDSCSKLLMEYSFGFSYGQPFVGNYTPPSCNFNRVVMNFTVTSRGRQFDRLASMYFGDTEVWRTSTAEPTVDGIRWTYMKDMSEYLYFWKQPQKLIFDLGNLIDSTYTGFFNTTLTAAFFVGPDAVDPAAIIIPISARKSASNSASLFIVPSDTAANTISFPRNVNRAVFSVSACGQASEEFWWSNVLQSNVNTFIPSDGVLPGFSPWREVQIYIDGQLAGVQWPFPVIFTGGVVPGLWRPIVGIDAFDLREHEIDITPWLPALCDGNQHTFEIKVAGINDDGGITGTVTEAVGNSWYVTGKIFVWLDAPSSITTGTTPIIILPRPFITLSQSFTKNTSTNVNQTLTYSTHVQRSLSISSVIKTQKGISTATWSQSLSYSNYGSLTDQGNTQVNTFSTTGLDTSTGLCPYRTSYNYPLFANTTFIVDSGSGNLSISATLSHGLNLEVTGNSIHPSGLESFSDNPHASSLSPPFSGSYLQTVQNGTGYYFSSPSTNTGLNFGSTDQVFSFGGVNAGASVELYNREVGAVNGTVARDKETLLSVTLGDYKGPAPPQRGMGMIGAVRSPKAVLGRGPGQSKPVLAQGERSG